MISSSTPATIPKIVAFGTADNVFIVSAEPGSGCLSGRDVVADGVGRGGGGSVAVGSGDVEGFGAVAGTGCSGCTVFGEGEGSPLFTKSEGDDFPAAGAWPATDNAVAGPTLSFFAEMAIFEAEICPDAGACADDSPTMTGAFTACFTR